jgi:acetylornithine deacetylase
MDSSLSKNATVLDTLADLIRINSVNPNYADGVPEIELADYVERFFRARRIDTERQLVFPNRPNVIARVAGRQSRCRVVLEAHMDTVGVGGMKIEPWNPVVRAGKMYGRGACDNKASLAAMMHALADLVASGVTPAGEVMLAATIDEEYSFRGVVALCEYLRNETLTSGTVLNAAAIVGEPTSLQVAVASKGVLRWKIETRGKSAHSSKPHLGISAINQMARLVTAIELDAESLAKRIHPLLGPATCNVGVIRGGVQINFVPDRCEIEVDRRLLPDEDTSGVLAHYRRLIDRTAAEYPPLDAIMHVPMLSDMPLQTDPNLPAVQSLQQVVQRSGLDAAPIGVPFGSDASKLAAIGIPSMIFGPGSIDQAHGAVEYVDCEQVVQAQQIYLAFLTESIGLL